MSWVAPSTVYTGQIATADDWNQVVVDNPTFLYGRIPRRFSHFFSDEMTPVVTSSQAYTHYVEYSVYPITNVTVGCWLEEGEYTLNILGISYSSSAFLLVYFDDSYVGSMNFNSAGTTYNVIRSLTISVTGSGRHKISFDRQNPSVYFRLTKLWIAPTSADDVCVS